MRRKIASQDRRSSHARWALGKSIAIIALVLVGLRTHSSVAPVQGVSEGKYFDYSVRIIMETMTFKWCSHEGASKPATQ